MKIAVRYFSRSGNTKAVADEIAREAGVRAISVDTAEAVFTEPVDVLFIGGALYAYGLDRRLKEFLKALKKDDVKKAVIFSTSWLSKHSIELIRKALLDKGILVEEESFYVRNKPNAGQLSEAREFAGRYC